MAIKQDFTTASGIDLPNAYWRIEAIRGDRIDLRVTVSIYADKSARDSGNQAVSSIEFTMPMPNENTNLFANIYTCMKTNTITVTNLGKNEQMLLDNPTDI